MKKKGISIIVLFMFMCLSIHISYAKDIKNNNLNYKSFTIINPVYKDLYNKNLFNSNSNSTDYGTIYSIEELKEKLYSAFKNRETNVNVKLCGNIVNETDMKDIQNAMDNALNLDDYTKYSYSACNMRYSTDGRSFMDIILNVEYLTNLEQEKFVDKKINEILDQIIKPNMNDDDKEKVIHDYIVSHVAYDESLREHSAYAALAKGKTVCQGYSLLMYKMLKHEGIECRIISSEEMRHAWNMVNLHGHWYHVDCTWDDPVPDVRGRIQHGYFNLSDKEMLRKEHTWDKNSYPKADIPYKYNPQLEPYPQPKPEVQGKLEYNNNILFNIKLNQKIKITKVELFDGDNYLGVTTNTTDATAKMNYKGILDDKVYKIKITVQDGRSCYANVSIKSSFKLEKFDFKNRLLMIKALTNGQLFINDKLVKNVRENQLLTLTNINKDSIIKVVSYENINRDVVTYESLTF